MDTERNSSVVQRSAKGGGKYKSMRLDEMSFVRLAYCKRVVNEHLGLGASHNAIVRRSLALLEAHLQKLVKNELGKPSDADWFHLIERNSIKAANEGSTCRISPGDVINSPTLKTIKELEAEEKLANPPPTYSEMLKKASFGFRKGGY